MQMAKGIRARATQSASVFGCGHQMRVCTNADAKKQSCENYMDVAPENRTVRNTNILSAFASADPSGGVPTLVFLMVNPVCSAAKCTYVLASLGVSLYCQILCHGRKGFLRLRWKFYENKIFTVFSQVSL